MVYGILESGVLDLPDILEVSLQLCPLGLSHKNLSDYAFRTAH